MKRQPRTQTLAADWRQDAIRALVQFARMVSEQAEPRHAIELLADALCEHAAAHTVAIVQVTEDGLRLAAARELPADVDVEGAIRDVDDLGSELGRALARACGDRFAEVRTLPLVNVGGLFGAAVLLRSKPTDGEAHDELAQGLVDLAASVLATASRIQSLERTNAELRASREALARTEKLRALGQMAAGVSHDLKNILNPLSLHLQVVQRANDKGQKEVVVESVVQMRQSLKRGLETIERLRDFSRQAPEAARKEADLNGLAHEALELARPRLTSGRAMSRVHEKLGSPPPITAQPSEIVSAVLNLLVNAIDAMPGGGNITLQTGERDGGAWISVADDGPGMTPEVQAHVFEPFFTTKGEEGTGLGLSMVYATVRRHGGNVHIESAPGAGAKFELWFPRAT